MEGGAQKADSVYVDINLHMQKRMRKGLKNIEDYLQSSSINFVFAICFSKTIYHIRLLCSRAQNASAKKRMGRHISHEALGWFRLPPTTPGRSRASYSPAAYGNQTAVGYISKRQPPKQAALSSYQKPHEGHTSSMCGIGPPRRGNIILPS